MVIPWQQLKTETLRALIQSFILREGTDYGEREALLETKIEQVMRQLNLNEVVVVFDTETESCDLRKAKEVGKLPPPPEVKPEFNSQSGKRTLRSREEKSFDQSTPIDFDQSVEE